MIAIRRKAFCLEAEERIVTAAPFVGGFCKYLRVNAHLPVVQTVR